MAILKPDKKTTFGGVTVNEFLLTKHNPRNIAMPSVSMEGKIIGVTIHNTSWISVAKGTTPAEQYTRATYNGNMNDVRVHYYVDHTCAWQNLPLDLSGWHAADGSGNGNRKTIAIECIMSSAYNANDRKSEDNAARLAVWTTSTIESILTNEKYKGSALLQKKFTVDFLTKKTKINEGEVPQYYVEESHPAIIPPEEFELVQAEYLRRKRLGRKYNSKSIFTARLICECCGGYYGSKVWHSTSKYRRVIWQCNHKFQNGEKCTTPHLYEEHIKDKFILAMNRILENKDEIIENCLLLSEHFTVSDDTTIETVTQEMDVVAELTRNLIQQNSVKPMKQELYKSEYEKLVQRYESLKAKRDALVSKKETMESKLKFILHYAETLRRQDAITEFSEDLWLKAIDHVTICRDGRMVFLFKDGSEITV